MNMSFYRDADDSDIYSRWQWACDGPIKSFVGMDLAKFVETRRLISRAPTDFGIKGIVLPPPPTSGSREHREAMAVVKSKVLISRSFRWCSGSSTDCRGLTVPVSAPITA